MIETVMLVTMLVVAKTERCTNCICLKKIFKRHGQKWKVLKPKNKTCHTKQEPLYEREWMIWPVNESCPGQCSGMYGSVWCPLHSRTASNTSSLSVPELYLGFFLGTAFSQKNSIKTFMYALNFPSLHRFSEKRGDKDFFSETPRRYLNRWQWKIWD